MNVGIITLYGDNYGNKLQNYALQELIRQLGHQPATIIVPPARHLHQPETREEQVKKFQPKYVSMAVSSRFKNRFPYKNQRDGILKSVRFGKTNEPTKLNQARQAAFLRFSEEYLLTKDCQDRKMLEETAKSIDAFVCGSDQVWNPNLASADYFLRFAPEQKRVAFAPSFGMSDIPEVFYAVYRNWLNDIPYLSVREEKGAALIKKLTGRDTIVLPDPTLCISREEWEIIESKPEFADGSYVLTYFLGNETNAYRKFIETYASKKGLKIIDLFDMRSPEYYVAGPSEFVWLIHHAKAMFTDSFHGTVFSLIFHTPFVVFDRIESGGISMSSRIETILHMTGMKNRIRNGMELERIDDIDFSKSDAAIEKQAQMARQFLAASLESAVKAVPVNSSLIGYLERKSDCSGCEACANVCPVSCIEMKADAEGFLYPVIDQKKCIHCGKCERTCPAINPRESKTRPEAYIGYSKDAETRRSSSSGGMFSMLAGESLNRGGFVYGAGFSESFSVAHRCAESRAALEKLRGSKYVQSRVGLTYREVKSKLERGELVYYSGTPCEIEGLLSFLGKDYGNLYTQDIICHGVPSPVVWQAYLKMMSRGEQLQDVSFRNKKYGWHYFSMRIKTNRKEYVRRLDEDIYTRLFLDNVILRPSCYACKFKKAHRASDFTLADCWGIEKLGGHIADDDKGVSLLFVNTDKGKRLLESLKDSTVLEPLDFDKAVNSQSAMTRSVPYNPSREVFFANAKEWGIEEAIGKWYGWDANTRLKRRVTFLKTQIKRVVKD